jgi:hypothetical protein
VCDTEGNCDKHPETNEGVYCATVRTVGDPHAPMDEDLTQVTMISLSLSFFLSLSLSLFLSLSLSLSLSACVCSVCDY